MANEIPVTGLLINNTIFAIDTDGDITLNGVKLTIKGSDGKSIASIKFTSTTDASGKHTQSGATDTYTITYTDNTTSTFNVYNGKDGSGGSDVASVNGKTGDVEISKSDIGLSNVDNTSDINKPISLDTQKAINLKANLNGDNTQTFKVANAVEDDEAINKGQFNSLLPKTIMPIISVKNSMNENEKTIITITNYDSKCSYNFSSDVGTVNYNNGNTAIFTAMNITDSSNHTGFISCYATKSGEIRSNSTVSNMTVVYVSATSDQTLSNANFKTNEAYNDGFTY